ncbi:MAG: type II toxin-antitoxin system VapC family toxin [Alphaproteobacteria bacterium]|nr:type II toxin-antitoxin system VapC family toxin [Alphaproteobacteria bacterium]
MIVVDASALIAILWKEPEADAFARAILEQDAALIAAPTRLEAFVACHRRRGPDNARLMEALVAALDLVTAPFDEAQLAIAQTAFTRFGSGAHRLNFGDCFSYALAKSRGLPLLFKGEDFRATDVEAAA